MSLTHALLGLIGVQPRSGYELTKAFEEDIGRYAWQAGHTSIYPELNRMATSGLIEVTHEGARGSRTYAITPAGRDELRGWLMREPEQSKVRNETVLRMFLISALEPDEALHLLRQIATHTAANAVELRAVMARNPRPALGDPDVFGLFAAEFGVRQFDSVNGWALWAIEQIEAAQQESTATASTAQG